MADRLKLVERRLAGEALVLRHALGTLCSALAHTCDPGRLEGAGADSRPDILIGHD